MAQGQAINSWIWDRGLMAWGWLDVLIWRQRINDLVIAIDGLISRQGINSLEQGIGGFGIGTEILWFEDSGLMILDNVIRFQRRSATSPE